jgi:hypothetical protein
METILTKCLPFVYLFKIKIAMKNDDYEKLLKKMRA